MEDMKFSKDQRVVYTDSNGAEFPGLVKANSRGMVMVKLDEPRETPMGWHASIMMVKASQVTPASQ